MGKPIKIQKISSKNGKCGDDEEEENEEEEEEEKFDPKEIEE